MKYIKTPRQNSHCIANRFLRELAKNASLRYNKLRLHSHLFKRVNFNKLIGNNSVKSPSAAAATDECPEGTSGCSDNEGSSTCACKSGYRLQNDKKSCDGEYFDQIKLCGVNLSNDLH